MAAQESTKWIIRRAVKEDAATIVHLIKELAEYVNEPLSNLTITVQDLERDGFGSDAWHGCFLAQLEGDQSVASGIGKTTSDSQPQHDSSIVAYVLFYRSYSTWHGRTMWIEDIYVQPKHRQQGIGQALVAEVVKVCESSGCKRVDWAVLNWNTLAKEFYKNIGVEISGEWQSCFSEDKIT